MKINKGLEKQMAKEIFTSIINANKESVERNYINYLKYTREYREEYDKRIQSVVMNGYSHYKINELKDAKTAK